MYESNSGFWHDSIQSSIVIVYTHTKSYTLRLGSFVSISQNQAAAGTKLGASLFDIPCVLRPRPRVILSWVCESRGASARDMTSQLWHQQQNPLLIWARPASIIKARRPYLTKYRHTLMPHAPPWTDSSSPIFLCVCVCVCCDWAHSLLKTSPVLLMHKSGARIDKMWWRGKHMPRLEVFASRCSLHYMKSRVRPFDIPKPWSKEYTSQGTKTSRP